VRVCGEEDLGLPIKLVTKVVILCEGLFSDNFFSDVHLASLLSYFVTFLKNLKKLLSFWILFLFVSPFGLAVEEFSSLLRPAIADESISMDDMFNPDDAGNRFISPYDAMANMPHNIMEFEHASGNWVKQHYFCKIEKSVMKKLEMKG